MSHNKEYDYRKKIKDKAKATKKIVRTRSKPEKIVDNQKESKKGVIIAFFKKLGTVSLVVVAVESILLAIFEATINSKSFINTNGKFCFYYIWVILPVLIIFSFTFLLLKKNDLLEKFRIFAAIITGVIAIILGYFSYEDSYKTNLTIVSEHQIYQIKFESRNHLKNIFDLEPKKIENNRYILDKKLPFDDYNITIFFKSNQSQFLTRTFKKRYETLVLF